MEYKSIIVKRIVLVEETFEVCEAETLEEAINIIKNDEETGDNYLIAQNILADNNYRAEDITNKNLSFSEITGIYPSNKKEDESI